MGTAIRLPGCRASTHRRPSRAEAGWTARLDPSAPGLPASLAAMATRTWAPSLGLRRLPTNQKGRAWVSEPIRSEDSRPPGQVRGSAAASAEPSRTGPSAFPRP